MYRKRETSSAVLMVALFALMPLGVTNGSPLSEAVEAAFQRHPDRNSAAAESALATAMQHKGDGVLSADPAVNIKYQTDGFGTDIGYREWEGGVSLPLWAPGQGGAYQREGDRQMDYAQAFDDAKRLEIAGLVRERMWAVEMARGERDQANAALRIARDMAVDIERRVKAGELPESDRLLATKEQMLREDRLHQAENRLSQAVALYQNLVGEAPPGEAVREQVPASGDASPDHPRLLLAQAGLTRAQARRDRVNASRRNGMSVWLGAKSTRAESGAEYDNAVGVELNVPLGLNRQHAPDLAAAEAELTQARADHARSQLEVTEALSIAQMELERTRTAQERALSRQSLADEAFGMSRKAFALGENDLFRLLQEQASAIDARHDYLVRTLEYHQAVARLNQALGAVPQ